MSNRKITTILGKAIREGKYLNIFYKNQLGEIKPLAIQSRKIEVTYNSPQ